MKKTNNILHFRANNPHYALAKIRIVFFLFWLSLGTQVAMQAQNSISSGSNNVLELISDPSFRTYLISRMSGTNSWDTNGDGILSPREAAQITVIDVTGMNIESLAGIEHFPALVTLWCKNNRLTTLDISSLRQLEVLNCSNNPLDTLYVWWAEGLNGRPKAHFVQFITPTPLQVIQTKDL